MRVVTNEKLIERNKRIAQILFFVSLAALGGSFFLSGSLTAQAATYFQCLVLPSMMILVVWSVRMTNEWVRKPHPWEAIPEGLKGIGTDTVMYNFLMPAAHVLVTSNGIFAIVTRFQDRPQKLVGDKWQGQNSLLGRLLAFMRQENMGNPAKEAQLRAKQTEVFLQELLGDDQIRVQPLIVFIHPNAEVTIEGEPSVPVLYASADKKKNTLKQYLKDAKKQSHPTLSKAQIDALDDVLLYAD
jgi:hypothetical protein